MKTNKGIIGLGLIVAIVLGIVVVGGGAYYVGKGSNKLEVKNPENKNITIDSAVVPSDWKTYSDKNLGFEFKYPTNSNIKDIINKGQYGLRGGTGTIEDLNKSAQIDANGDSSLISRVIVDGQEARTVCWQNGYCNISILSPKPMTLQGNPNQLYVLVIGLPGITPEYSIQKKDLDNIISTFRFIEVKSPYEGL